MAKQIDMKIVEGLLELALILIKITKDERIPADVRQEILNAIYKFLA